MIILLICAHIVSIQSTISLASHKGLNQEVVEQQTILDEVVECGKELEKMASVSPLLQPDLKYSRLQERYKELKVSTLHLRSTVPTLYIY